MKKKYQIILPKPSPLLTSGSASGSVKEIIELHWAQRTKRTILLNFAKLYRLKCVCYLTVSLKQLFGIY